MDYSIETTNVATSTQNADGAVAIIGLLFGGVFTLVWLALAAVMIVSMWKLFTKAGKPGWASIVPVYNIIVMCEIAGRPLWWVAMLFIPVANIVFGIILTLDFVKSYGKDILFAVLSLFFPYVIYPMMAFDKNTKYVGPVGSEHTSQAVAQQPPAPQPPVQQ